jgi:hypothetical protein
LNQLQESYSVTVFGSTVFGGTVFGGTVFGGTVFWWQNNTFGVDSTP